MSKRITVTDVQAELLAELLEDYALTHESADDPGDGASEYHEAETRNARLLIERVTGRRHPSLEVDRMLHAWGLS